MEFQFFLRMLYIAALLSASTLRVNRVGADDSTSIDITVNTSGVGVFSVSLSNADSSDPTFGVVGLDADLDVSVEGTFKLEYTDTLTDRGEGAVSLSFDSFEPVEPVPPFLGSDQVHFQIPNRYLVLTEVGDVTVESPSTACSSALGSITADANDEAESFDNGHPLTVASVSAGCGVGIASQSIGITLTVPAGVYPTTYEATVTIESTID